MATFGVSAEDGTLAPCKARPENRGRGTCFHGDHVDLDGAMAAPETIRAYNEERLAEHYKTSALASLRKKVPSPAQMAFPKVTHGAVQSHPKGRELSRKEFGEATVAIADSFPEGSWELLNGFYSRFNSLLEEEEALKRTKAQTINRVRDFLESDAPIAKKVREYLGDDVSPEAFSAILVADVHSMTARNEWRNHPKGSLSRALLTTVGNDMNKRRYVASVLFFGGRCCYCNRALSKHQGPRQATGEHLTPLNPDNAESPVGGTRYGNMALACFSCNHDRGNKDLDSWVAETDCIPPASKGPALERIKAFRRFALYEDYSQEQSARIRAGLEDLKTQASACERQAGVFKRDDFARLQEKFKATVYDLQSTLDH